MDDFIKKLHPTLKKRLDTHLTQTLKGSPDDVIKAGRAGSHAEIRALDALLKEIDPLAKHGDEIFKEIIGFNRDLLNTANNNPRCIHCWYLTDDIKMIGND
ncbi:MAG: hypothetical protein KIS94_05175 [Chitinophagales bacterium]|nr:hypothetical protein [Chitinophagales bacterium]